MQEVFARAWARFHDLALDADQQRNWLFAVARNLLVSELRRKRVRSKRSLAAWLDLRVPDNSSPLWAMASERQRASHALKRSFTSSAWSLHHSQSLWMTRFRFWGLVGMCGFMSTPVARWVEMSSVPECRAGL